MKLRSLSAWLGSATVFLLTTTCDAKSSHHKLHQLGRRNHHFHGALHSRTEHGSTSGLTQKRGQLCRFPDDDPDLYAVSPDSMNAGWAMSPDQECKPGSYCPIACKPGMVMAQWDPDSSYTFPVSMNGGLYCDHSGYIQKHFPNEPNCVHGTSTVQVVNKCSAPMFWCQTVLPGNEAMLIPTIVDRVATLTVPGPNYWCSTSAHYYINPPGTGAEGCVWGDSSKSVGNWSPFVAGAVAGANTDPEGRTFLKLGWNPIWQSSLLKHQKPTFGVKVECPHGGCNGLPCNLYPNSYHNGAVDSLLAAVGAGDSAYCVVTVPAGTRANIVAYDGSGGRRSSPLPPATPASAPAEKEVSPAHPPPSSSFTTTPTTTTTTTTTTSTSTTTTSTKTSTTTPSTSPPFTTSRVLTTSNTTSARTRH